MKYNNLNTNKKPVLEPGVGIINTPNWEYKVKHHTDYLHNNPLMYDKRLRYYMMIYKFNLIFIF